MDKKDYLIAKKLKERISSEAELVDFRIFGSRARGDQAHHSDMDVFIEVKSLNKELKEKIYEIAWEIGFDNYMVISILVFTLDEIENSALRVSPIVKNIQEEGIRI